MRRPTLLQATNRDCDRDKAEWVSDYRIVHPGGGCQGHSRRRSSVLSTSGHLIEFVGTVDRRH